MNHRIKLGNRFTLKIEKLAKTSLILYLKEVLLEIILLGNVKNGKGIGVLRKVFLLRASKDGGPIRHETMLNIWVKKHNLQSPFWQKRWQKTRKETKSTHWTNITKSSIFHLE